MSKQQWSALFLMYVGWLAGTLGVDDVDGVIYQPPHIEAAVGHPVNLSCTFNYTGEEDLIFFGKFYKGNSKKGYDVPETCQSIGKQFIICSLSLTIEMPSLADEDLYFCEVVIPLAGRPTILEGSGTLLALHAQPSSIEIQQASFLVSEHKATLDCSISRFYPRNISVLWFHGGTPVLPGCITEDVTLNDDGTFSLISRYKFSPTAKDNNAECVCQASHPAWKQTKRTSIALGVRYGPEIVNVTSNSEAVTNGSVRVPCGSTLHLTCSADGNPKSMTQWLGGSIKGAQYEETLHIPAVQGEHGGLYWCVAKNMYGEQNTSITLLVSCCHGNTNKGANKPFCGLALIPFACVTGIVICHLKKGRRKDSAPAGLETVVYAEMEPGD